MSNGIINALNPSHPYTHTNTARTGSAPIESPVARRLSPVAFGRVARVVVT